MTANATAKKTRTSAGATAKTDQASGAVSPATPAAANGKDKAAQVVQIRPDQCSLFHFKNNRWHFIVPPDLDSHQLESTNFCSLVARDLNRFDDVRIIADDGSWFADAIVAQAWTTGAQLRVLDIVQIGAESDHAAEEIPAGYSIRKAGISDDQRGFLVVRNEDGHVMNYGNPLHSHHDARAWLMNHSSVVGNINANGIWRG